MEEILFSGLLNEIVCVIGNEIEKRVNDFMSSKEDTLQLNITTPACSAHPFLEDLFPCRPCTKKRVLLSRQQFAKAISCVFQKQKAGLTFCSCSVDFNLTPTDDKLPVNFKDDLQDAVRSECLDQFSFKILKAIHNADDEKIIPYNLSVEDECVENVANENTHFKFKVSFNIY